MTMQIFHNIFHKKKMALKNKCHLLRSYDLFWYILSKQGEVTHILLIDIINVYFIPVVG